LEPPITIITLVFHHLAGPDLAHGHHVVIVTGPSAFEGHAHGIEFLPQPTDTRPQHEAAAGQHIEAGGLLRQQQRVGLGQDVDAGAQAQGLGVGRHRGEGDKRVQEGIVGTAPHFSVLAVGVLRLVLHRHHDMLEGPDGFKALGLDKLGQAHQLFQGLHSDVDRDQSDFHFCRSCKDENPAARSVREGAGQFACPAL
jgi:hypothetical protein